MSVSLLSYCHRIRVSSVLNNDVKQFGKKFLLDGNEETCWNSDQAPNGSGQWIVLDFKEAILPKELHLMFQGGFVGKTCKLEAAYDEQQTDTFSSIMEFYPNDDNSRQIFQITGIEKKVKRLKIVFSESTDFYGRITVYCLDIVGKT